MKVNLRYFASIREELGQGSEAVDTAAPTLAALAAKYGKTPGQVVLRWQVERGVVAIPRSGNPSRIAQNIDIFDFALTPQEVAAITALDTGADKGVDSDIDGH